MSFKPELVPPIPEEAKRFASSVRRDSQSIKIAKAQKLPFPKGNTYMRVRDELGTFYQDEQLAFLFPSRGQPAESPWRLALICVMQYEDGCLNSPTVS